MGGGIEYGSGDDVTLSIHAISNVKEHLTHYALLLK